MCDGEGYIVSFYLFIYLFNDFITVFLRSTVPKRKHQYRFKIDLKFRGLKIHGNHFHWLLSVNAKSLKFFTC